MPAGTECQLAVPALTDEIHQRRDAVLHRSHRHQKSSLEREEEHDSLRRADSDKSATSATRRQQQQQQCSIACELTGGVCDVARHPPHRSRSRQTHYCVTVKRPQPYTSDSNHLHDRETASALTCPSSCLDGGVTRVGLGRYPQYIRGDFGPEAVGSSNHRHITSPKRQTLREGKVPQK